MLPGPAWQWSAPPPYNFFPGHPIAARQRARGAPHTVPASERLAAGRLRFASPWRCHDQHAGNLALLLPHESICIARTQLRYCWTRRNPGALAPPRTPSRRQPVITVPQQQQPTRFSLTPALAALATSTSTARPRPPVPIPIPPRPTSGPLPSLIPKPSPMTLGSPLRRAQRARPPSAAPSRIPTLRRPPPPPSTLTAPY